MTSAIRARMDSDLKDAMRAKEKEKVETLRFINAAVKQIEVDERIVVDEARMLVILDKLAKQRQESIAQFAAAHRDDLVQKEQFQLDIVRHYLPEPLSTDAIEHLLQKTIAEVGATEMRDMGKVMTIVRPQVQGRADMAMVSERLKALLT
jgi:uncharacterized protein YqeY